MISASIKELKSDLFEIKTSLQNMLGDYSNEMTCLKQDLNDMNNKLENNITESLDQKN